jgi:hypothetical protein
MLALMGVCLTALHGLLLFLFALDTYNSPPPALHLSSFGWFLILLYLQLLAFDILCSLSLLHLSALFFQLG